MPLNFQQVILTLQQFWAERGALLWQPYYTQVGAGTMNPATFLRVLGPEATLRRGYSITRTERGELIRSVADVRGKMKIKTRVSDGEFESTTL